MFNYEFNLRTFQLLSDEQIENIIYFLKKIGQDVYWDVSGYPTMHNEIDDVEIPY